MYATAQVAVDPLTTIAICCPDGPHDLQGHELFTDAAIVELLDRIPRQHLYALTTGSDPCQPQENRPAAHDGASGAELLRAVRNRRLWLNITEVDRVDGRYRDLIDQLHADLAARIPDLRNRCPHAQRGAGLGIGMHIEIPSLLWRC